MDEIKSHPKFDLISEAVLLWYMSWYGKEDNSYFHFMVTWKDSSSVDNTYDALSITDLFL